MLCFDEIFSIVWWNIRLTRFVSFFVSKNPSISNNDVVIWRIFWHFSLTVFVAKYDVVIWRNFLTFYLDNILTSISWKILSGFSHLILFLGWLASSLHGGQCWRQLWRPWWPKHIETPQFTRIPRRIRPTGLRSRRRKSQWQGALRSQYPGNRYPHYTI